MAWSRQVQCSCSLPHAMSAVTGSTLARPVCMQHSCCCRLSVLIMCMAMAIRVSCKVGCVAAKFTVAAACLVRGLFMYREQLLWHALHGT
jgi:hypothetical protein